MGGCSFRSKQLTGVVISPQVLKAQNMKSLTQNKGIAEDSSANMNPNVDKSAFSGDNTQNGRPNVEPLSAQNSNLSQKTREMSAAKKNLLESRKLDADYTIIPNQIHHNAITIPHDEASGLVGLKNLGNTCFMNSALQCLLNTPPLADYFMNDIHIKEINKDNFLGSKGVVTSAFADLYKQYWTREDINVIDPQDFYEAISKFAPQFSHGTQEDSQEFMAFLLDIIHEDLNRVKDKPYIADKDHNDNKLEEHATESWKYYLMRNKSIIVDLFQGQSKSTLKCLQCGYVSHKFEPFMYLSLPIPEDDGNKPKVSLIECLKEYSKEEKLDGEEKWNCTRCKVPVDSTKKIEIWKLPNILIVHLKRFKFTREMRGKVQTFIDFPHADLDLGGVAAGAQRDLPIYDLFAISNHEGSLSDGHYFTFAKNRDNHNWYAYNDSEVMTLSSEQLVSSSAYLLFFSKTSVADFSRQTLSRPDAWPHLSKSMLKSQISSKTNLDLLPSKRTSLNKPFDLNQIRQSISTQHLLMSSETHNLVDRLNTSNLAQSKQLPDYSRYQTEQSPMRSIRDPTNDPSRNLFGQIDSNKQSLEQKHVESKLATEKISFLTVDNGVTQNLGNNQSVSRSRNITFGNEGEDNKRQSPDKSENRGFLPSNRRHDVPTNDPIGLDVTPEIKYSKKSWQIREQHNKDSEENLKFLKKIQ